MTVSRVYFSAAAEEDAEKRLVVFFVRPPPPPPLKFRDEKVAASEIGGGESAGEKMRTKTTKESRREKGLRWRGRENFFGGYRVLEKLSFGP